ncbi:MAG: hypothetical protein ACXAE3_17430, partial [Candidatus Kariarchaeaceae archaeon]
MDISTSSILAQLRGYTVSAVISTTLQLGLYWELEEHSWDETDIAEHYSIPIHRIDALIQLQIDLGLLERHDQSIRPSDAMRQALEVYSRDTWQWIAFEGQRFHG